MVQYYHTVVIKSTLFRYCYYYPPIRIVSVQIVGGDLRTVREYDEETAQNVGEAFRLPQNTSTTASGPPSPCGSVLSRL